MTETSARGSVERIEPTKAEGSAARRVAESKATIPHLYVSGRLQLRGDDAIAAIVRAAAQALRDAPKLNGSYRDGAFETYSRVNIGVVAAGVEGPVVPTIFDADTKGRAEIASELEALSARVESGEITARELAGGTFTVASGFGFDGSAFLPVINAGQAANLGIGSPDAGGSLAAVVAADARMISGAEAAHFLRRVQDALAAQGDPD